MADARVPPYQPRLEQALREELRLLSRSEAAEAILSPLLPKRVSLYCRPHSQWPISVAKCVSDGNLQGQRSSVSPCSFGTPWALNRQFMGNKIAVNSTVRHRSPGKTQSAIHYIPAVTRKTSVALIPKISRCQGAVRHKTKRGTASRLADKLCESVGGLRALANEQPLPSQ